jgi:hypothetical protein
MTSCQKHGDSGSVRIKNLSRNLPKSNDDTTDFIGYALYQIVHANNKNIKSADEISGAIVRQNSTKQISYDDSTGIYQYSLIVDIEPLRQSYKITYATADDMAVLNKTYSNNLALASCLDKSELIYGDFNCKDPLSDQQDTTPDPAIAKYLPYNDYGEFEITDWSRADNGQIRLNIIAIAPRDQDSISQDLLNQYKSEITNWIKSHNLSPDNYIYNFTS